ncbi:hypothetical protein B0H34DRAFT_801031 [Crassisporium funariophilum]|nr:hypothetical protein B0H34DRAFT_801031 [Crassisporium funariophilum]
MSVNTVELGGAYCQCCPSESSSQDCHDAQEDAAVILYQSKFYFCGLRSLLPPIDASLVQVPRPISSPDTDIPLLLQELHRAIISLPPNVLPGIPSDPLAIFAHPPTAFLKADQDAWEDIVNPTLDCVLGFGANTES